MYRIGEFSKLTKTTVKTLRYYDKEGILKPAQIDPFTGYRFYTTRQLILFHEVQGYRQIGLTIEEIKRIIDGHDKKVILQKRLGELKTEITEGKNQLSRIEFILSGKEEEMIMSYQAVLKETPECIVYYKQLTVPNYNAYFEVIPKIGEEVTAANPDLKCSVPEYCFIRYLDEEYKEKDINVEFCEAVEKFGNETDTIKFKKMDSVKVASVLHKGPYSGLGKAYAFIMKWIEENGYAVKESPRESYIDGIWNKESEDEWLTEIQVPIE